MKKCSRNVAAVLFNISVEIDLVRGINGATFLAGVTSQTAHWKQLKHFLICEIFGTVSFYNWGILLYPKAKSFTQDLLP